MLQHCVQVGFGDQQQVFRVLDEQKTVVDFNNRWLGQLGSHGLIRLAGRYTLARMMEREDFRTRFQEGKPIHLHELLYPLAQGYDSVVKLLVERGAELNARNAKGQTPLGALIARAGGRGSRKSTIDLLRSLGGVE